MAGFLILAVIGVLVYKWYTNPDRVKNPPGTGAAGCLTIILLCTPPIGWFILLLMAISNSNKQR